MELFPLLFLRSAPSAKLHLDSPVVSASGWPHVFSALLFACNIPSEVLITLREHKAWHSPKLVPFSFIKEENSRADGCVWGWGGEVDNERQIGLVIFS